MRGAASVRAAPTAAGRLAARPAPRAAPAVRGPAPPASTTSTATLDTRAFDGAAKAGSSSQLTLRVADPENASAVVHRYVVLLNQNARAGNASTLTRSEVRGGGKKPYAQKGTGNARIGSRRTPLKPGGGIVFGPKPVDWSIKMNKKERRLAMATALASAAGDVVAVDSVALPDAKTRTLVSRLAALGADTATQNVLIVADDVDDNLRLASRNVERLSVNKVTALSARDVLKADRIVVDAKSVAYINEFYGPPKAAA